MKVVVVCGAVTIVALLLIVNAGKKGEESRNSTEVQSVVLSQIAEIGSDQNFPLIDESCWDWFPEGDGIVWGTTTAQGGEFIEFPFSKVEKGQATIPTLGTITTGDVVFRRYSNGIQPIFKIIEIDPAKGGVLIAITGNFSGGCQPNQPGYGPQQRPA